MIRYEVTVVKRTISLLLAVVAVSLYCVSVFADTPTQEVIDDLQEYNIIEKENDLRLEDDLTRAEAAKIICTLVAGDRGTEHINVYEIFSDVPINHWAAKYLIILENDNIVSGDENGKFNPDEKVTYSQFVKMLVCALGYEDCALANGGYPRGYVVYAYALGVIETIKPRMYFDSNYYITRAEAMELIYKSLDVPLKVLRQTNIEIDGSATPVYEIRDGRVYPLSTLRTRLENNEFNY